MRALRFQLRVSFLLWLSFTGNFILSCREKDGSQVLQADRHLFSSNDTLLINEWIRKAADFAQVDLDSLAFYSNKAFKMADSSRYLSGLASAAKAKANYERRVGNYPEAIRLGLDAVKRYADLHMTDEMISAQLLVAEFYKEMGGEKNTAEYQETGLAMARNAQQAATEIGFIPGIINSMNMQGIILRDISKTTGKTNLMDSAFHLYEKAIQLIASSGKGEELSGKLFNNISQVYNEHYGNYDKAMEFQQKAVAFNERKNNRISLTHNYNTISEIYLNKGDLLHASIYAHRMLALCRDIGAPFRTVNAYGLLSVLHKRTGRFDSALYYYQQRVRLSDSLNNLQRSSQIAHIQTLYETELKDSRIRELDHENLVRSQRFKALMAGAAILFVFLLVVWRQMIRSRQQKEKIRQQSEKLQWMMKELHHRVKNNLQIISSLLNLQSYRLQDQDGADVIRESQLRVQAMSLMHQRLYQVEDVSMVNFKLYLVDLAETLMRAYGFNPDEFDLVIDVEEEMMNVDLVMPLGLLVNEIFTNSFKYAFDKVKRPSIRLSMKRSDKNLVLEIADNGPGFEWNAKAAAGFGQKLIQALSKQLKGKITMNNQKGTAYRFDIPYQEKAA